MEWIVVVLLVLLALVTVVVAFKRKSGATGLPYKRNEVLVSPAERSFLGVLEMAVADQYRVFAKVRVADVISVKGGVSQGQRQSAFNRISAKHFDFLLCSREDVSIVAAIELDDKSHQQRKRQQRDDFLEAVCAHSELPLIRVPAQAAYSPAELRSKILAVLAPAELAVEESAITSSASEEAIEDNLSKDDPASSNESQGSAPRCPKCASPMVRRQARSGANVGQSFWGCSHFPRCRGKVTDDTPTTTPR